MSGYSAGSWDKQLDKAHQYKLEDLLWNVGLSVDGSVECVTKEFLKTVLGINASSSFQERDAVRCGYDQKLYGFQSLNLLATSSSIHPDAFVEVKAQNVNMQVLVWVPVLVVQVFSSEYKATLAKLTILLIDQLRLLRYININISKCTGFVFPRQQNVHLLPR